MDSVLKGSEMKGSELERLVAILIAETQERDILINKIEKLQETMDELHGHLQHADRAHHEARKALYEHINNLSRF